MKLDFSITNPPIPLYTLEIVYPAYLAVGQWAVLNVTLTAHQEGEFVMNVPIQTNATLKSLQAPDEQRCNMKPNMVCYMQWAVKSDAPGAVEFHMLPTFQYSDKKQKGAYRFNIRFDPVEAYGKGEPVLSVIFSGLSNVVNTLSAAAGLLLSVLTLMGRLPSSEKK